MDRASRFRLLSRFLDEGLPNILLYLVLSIAPLRTGRCGAGARRFVAHESPAVIATTAHRRRPCLYLPGQSAQRSGNCNQHPAKNVTHLTPSRLTERARVRGNSTQNSHSEVAGAASRQLFE